LANDLTRKFRPTGLVSWLLEKVAVIQQAVSPDSRQQITEIKETLSWLTNRRASRKHLADWRFLQFPISRSLAKMKNR